MNVRIGRRVHGVAWAGVCAALSTVPVRAQSPDSGGASRLVASTLVLSSPQDDTRAMAVLQRRIDIDVANVALSVALKEVARRGRIGITYSNDVGGMGRRVTLRRSNVTIGDALTALLAGVPLRAVVTPSGDIVLVRHVAEVEPPAPTGALVGRVTARATGEAVASATVFLTPSKAHGTTDDSGAYHIPDVPPGTYQATAQRIGFLPSVQSVTIGPGQPTRLDFALATSPRALSQVVVTASKAPTEIRDVPAAVEVVTSKTIQVSGAQNLMQALQTTTGVTAAQFGENFQSIQLRGLPRLENENETVLILIDGVPQTDARNSAQINDIPVNMIDQIEVVRGPSSALYGRTAIGGTINILTPQPTPTQRFTADLQVGDLGYVRGTATASGPLGDRSGYVLSWQGDRHDGFQFPPIQRQLEALFGKFTSHLDDKTQLMMTANYVTNLGGTPSPIPIENGRLLSNVDPAFPYYRNLNLPYAQYNQEDLRGTIKVTRELSSAFTVSNTAAYRHSRYDFLNDGDVLSPPSSPDSATVVLFPFTSHREEDAYFNDLQLEGTFGPRVMRHRLITGLDFERNTGNRSSILPYGPTTADSLAGGVTVNYRNPQYPGLYDLRGVDIGGSAYYTTFYSAYLQDEIDILDRLRISLGGRFDLNEISATPIGPTTHTTITGTFRKFTPRVGVSYRLLDGRAARDPQLSVFAQYSQGFLPPASSIDPQSTQAPSEKPETITNYEAGFKGSILGGLLGVDASAFYLKRDGIALQLRTSGNTFAITNGGVQDFPGVEVGLNSQIGSAVSLFAKYAYYGAHFGPYAFNNGTTTDVSYTGNRIALAPKDVYDVGGTFNGPAGLGLYLAGHFEGSRYLDYANTFLLGSYFVTNGRVSWRFLRYTVAVAVSNIFDQRYLTDGDLSTAQFAFPGAPRRVVCEFTAAY
ncbi:MAG TPA: TonB-dependent receptor [Gemmatimonadaceae bacterium]|nr:TonB-dependent receptor [Gemmatimonadaceae bacterium]